MKEFIDNYIKEKIDKHNKTKKIVRNEEYMLWLESFTNQHSSFCDDFYQDANSSVNKNDVGNVKSLNILFTAVKNYADDNFIKPFVYSVGEYYNIKFNSNIYQIGILNWEGTLYFCDRTKNCDKGIIDFENIKNYKKNQNIDLIKMRLQMLSELIEIMSKEEIPLKAITDTTNNTIQKILNKKK